MKRILVFVLSLCLAANVLAFDVPGILSQLQEHRLAECPAESADRGVVQRLQADFDKVVAAAEMVGTPFRVSECRVLAQVRAGTVVVSTQLSDLPEKERLFVMAHELGHIKHGDWSRQVQRYADYAGSATSFEEMVQKMKEVNPEIALMSRDGEFAADTFAIDVLTKAGYPAAAGAQSFLRRYKDQPESETHPAVRARLERVRSAS